MRLTPEQREVIGYLIAAADGDTSEEQCARVDELVKDSEEMQLFVVQLLNQEAWLSQHSLHESTRTVEADFTSKIRELLTAAETSMISQAIADQYATTSCSENDITIADAAGGLQPQREREPNGHWAWIPNARSWVAPAVYPALLVGIGVAIGSWLDRAVRFPGDPLVAAEDSSNRAVGETLVAANCQAQLVQYTSCVWGPEMRPRTSNSLSGGDSLNLIYGLADLELDWPSGGTAKVRLEGPAGMVLMVDGGVNLNHGKLTVSVTPEGDRFAVETPLGRVEIDADAKIGVSVSPRATEVHVFRGEAKIVTSWASDSNPSEILDVQSDQSIQLIATESGTVQVRRGTAARDFFVTQIEMTDDLLDISEEYVSTIINSGPLCYWRFNRPTNGVIRNEMSDRYHGRVLGPAEWVRERDNWTIQCGGWLATDMTPSHVVADRPLESPGVRNYSLEVWVKPSHFHLGSIASLLSQATDSPGFHGMLLELGGPWSIFTGREHPGRVRFLHRNPPDQWGGNSCFSDAAYGLRRWQHVVAVKSETALTLYIDGQRVAHCTDTTPLPDKLTLLVGQLDQERNQRLFIGQLDELAYYERALSEEEIRAHYDLGKPTNAPANGI